MMRPAKQHRPGLWTVSPNRRGVAAKRDIGKGLRGADVAAFQCRSEELARGEETGNLPPAIGEEFDTPEHAAHDPVNAVRPAALGKQGLPAFRRGGGTDGREMAVGLGARAVGEGKACEVRLDGCVRNSLCVHDLTSSPSRPPLLVRKHPSLEAL